MNFMDSIKAYWANYANFKGRTSKATFWWTILFLVLASSLIGALFPGGIEVTHFAGVDIESRANSIAQNVWSIATFLPSLALGVRRLHDVGKPGTYLWFGLIPIAGFIMLLVWFLQAGQPAANAHGEPVK